MAAPRLPMLDEPSLGLAPVIVKAVYEALVPGKQRVPLVIVEQNAAVSLSICDRGVVLRSGRVAVEGTSEHLNDAAALMDSYLGHTDEASQIGIDDPPVQAST